jgi:DNA-binding transcriptional regulator YiaG
MTNLATVLKSEVSRLARKEVRTHTDGLKKAISGYRTEIASLKKRVSDLEKQVDRASRSTQRQAKVEVAEEGAEDGVGLRFRAAGMAANRKRLGLSAADFGKLVGATGQSIYSWETGKSKPRSQSLAAIAALRGIGKREVAVRLAALA